MSGMTFDSSFQRELAIESWILYSIGLMFIILRMFSRLKRGGFKAFVVDDYLMLLAAVLYTMLIVSLNAIAAGGGSNLFPPEQLSTFSPEDIKERIKGSKIVVVSEQAMLNLIYVLKACMICIYGRLTLQLEHSIFVKALAIYTACGYVGSELAFFLACRPFTGYWAVPPPNPQCTTLQHYAITQACFNTTSDAMMLAISIPLLLSAGLPPKQKVIMITIFGMGVFVILAAILTKVFNLKDPYSTVYMLWYVREASVAVYVVNLPLVWPLIRDTFPFLRSFSPEGGRSYSGTRERWQGTSGKTSRSFRRAQTYSEPPPPFSGSKSAGSRHTVYGERGFEAIRMESLRRKRDVDEVSLDSDEHALHAGGAEPRGINQEFTIDVVSTSAGTGSAATSVVGSSVVQRDGWEGVVTPYQVDVTATGQRAAAGPMDGGASYFDLQRPAYPSAVLSRNNVA